MVEKNGPTMEQRKKIIKEFVDEHYLVGNDVAKYRNRPDLVLTEEEREISASITILRTLEGLLTAENLRDILENGQNESVEVVSFLRRTLEFGDIYKKGEQKQKLLMNLLRNG